MGRDEVTDHEEATKPAVDGGSDVIRHHTASASAKVSWTGSMRSPGAVYGAAPSLGPLTATFSPGGMIHVGPAKAVKTVVLPTQMTQKVLVAFLDEDDDTVWAKKLKPEDITINYDDEGHVTMSLELSLDDVYKNEVPK